MTARSETALPWVGALLPEQRGLVAVETCTGYEAGTVNAAVRALLARLGGMDAFVSPGQTVLLKPNLLSPRPPEEGVTTHPVVVAAVAQLCLAAGAGRVWVADSCAGAHAEVRLWRTTGMSDAVPAAGGELKTMCGPPRPLRCGTRFIPVPEWLDQVDVVISLPKLKTHMLTTLTCALKNVYGLVAGEAKAFFHGDYPSPNRMSAFLVDVFEATRPSLNIVDAVEAMEGDGPATGRVANVGLLLAGVDAVAIDAVGAGMLDLAPTEIPMIRAASERGLGEADRDSLQLVGNGVNMLSTIRLRRARGRFLQRLPQRLYHALTWIMTYRPIIDQEACVRCGICAGTCSQAAIQQQGDSGEYRIDPTKCILCMCCVESCPEHALKVRSPFHAIRRFIRRLRGRGMEEG